MLTRSPFRCMLLARLPSLMLATCLHWGHPLQLTHMPAVQIWQMAENIYADIDDFLASAVPQ